MEHLTFIDELDKFGIKIRSTNCENQTREYEIYGLFNESNFIISKDFELSWKNKIYFGEDEALTSLLRKAIDFDSWKHSWHIEIKPENYPKIKDIIQRKIIGRAKEIDELMAIYFQLQYEIAKDSEKTFMDMANY